MTIKLPDCNICHNSGVVAHMILPPLSFEVFDQYNPTVPEAKAEYKTHFCVCQRGQQRAQWENSTLHPEYENSLAKMSDAEILQAIEKTSVTQRAIDKEFES